MTEQNQLTAYTDDINENTEALAGQLGLLLVCGVPESAGAPYLFLDGGGLTLCDGELTLQGDFTRMLKRLRVSNLRAEMLVKAAKIKSFGENPVALDATAGLGEDSLLLAAAGFSVELYEYNPVIAALLQDAMRRAADVPELSEAVGRMRLFKEDSVGAMSVRETPPELILLDPMFPARQKSALVKKKFQLLQQLECPCPDEKELVAAAIAAHPKKIVIKRPSKGPYLGGVKPGYSVEGNGIRYDCIVFNT